MIQLRAKDEPQVLLQEVTDPGEVARHRAWHEKFRRNSEWLEAHWKDVLPRARGQFLAVACQQPFVAPTEEEALTLARSAHPDDEGVLVQYVLPQGGARIYAYRG